MTLNRYYHEYFVLKDIGHSMTDPYDALGMDRFAFQTRAGGWRP